MKIAITCHYASLPENHPTWQRAVQMAEVVLSEKPYLSQEELLEFVQGADALISGTDFIKADMIAKLPETLKVISRPAVGYDRVDIAAARARGIDVCNSPGTNTDSVAELTIALMLSCARRLPEHFANCKEKKWSPGADGMELKGKTLGILGFGAIGRETALRAKAFGMRVIGYSRHIDKAFCALHGIEPATQESILRESDILSLHMPQTPATEGYLCAERLEKMKKGAVLINTSRGKLINRAGLIAALESGQIRCYGTDVMQEEPPEAGDPLFEMEQVYITPHIGASTEEAHMNMMDVAMTNALDILSGKPCRNIVNRREEI